MTRSKVEVYLHIVWTTIRRAPLLSPVIEPQVHKCIASQAMDLGCTVYAIDGTENHVHLVLRLPVTCPIAQLLKKVKGVSSHFVNEHYRSDDYFRWQERYGAFSISRSHLQRVVR